MAEPSIHIYVNEQIKYLSFKDVYYAKKKNKNKQELPTTYIKPFL